MIKFLVKTFPEGRRQEQKTSADNYPTKMIKLFLEGHRQDKKTKPADFLQRIFLKFIGRTSAGKRNAKKQFKVRLQPIY